MAHRKALVAAAAVATVLLAGAVSLGATVGVLDSGTGGVGELSATSATPAETRVIDVVCDQPPDPAAQADASLAGVSDEERWTDQHSDDEEGEDEHHDGDEHPDYEGHDDDD